MSKIVETGLEEILDAKKREVKTDSYPMSIGEAASMYNNDELILDPKYQRYFRWTDEQKSKLIESILVGLPLPSFFVATGKDGKWEVVDGVQRLSTIFDFMGILRKDGQPEGYERFERLSDDFSYLKGGFEGKSWNEFSQCMQLDFKRSKLQFTILMREISDDAKFELFKRLNSGGAGLTDQEFRNADLEYRNPELLRRIENLSKDNNFSKVVSLSNDKLRERRDMEITVRFIIFLKKGTSSLSSSSVMEFLDKKLIEISEDNNFDFDRVAAVFTRTFKKLGDLLDGQPLRSGRGKLSDAYFEVVAFGVAQNIDALPSDDIMKGKIQSIKDNNVFKEASKAGNNAAYRIPKLLDLGKKYFSA